MTHLFLLLSEYPLLQLILAPVHVNGRFSSVWKGAGSNFKCSFRVSHSPMADTRSLLSSHGNNLCNVSICKIGGLGVFCKKQTLLHLDCLCLYVHVDSEF